MDRVGAAHDVRVTQGCIAVRVLTLRQLHSSDGHNKFGLVNDPRASRDSPRRVCQRAFLFRGDYLTGMAFVDSTQPLITARSCGSGT
jgi:hypothetical protein